MAYQMIHMEIAYRLLKRMPQITNAAEFILGSVAPDSVHMNPDYSIDLKVKSHMLEGCGEWGDTQDYQRWTWKGDQNIKRNIFYFGSGRKPAAFFVRTDVRLLLQPGRKCKENLFIMYYTYSVLHQDCRERSSYGLDEWIEPRYGIYRGKSDGTTGQGNSGAYGGLFHL